MFPYVLDGSVYRGKLGSCKLGSKCETHIILYLKMFALEFQRSICLMMQVSGVSEAKSAD